MDEIPENVRQDLIKLVPASVINEISCFQFYDDHPRDCKNLDVIICTNTGELKEYHKRELVNTIILDVISRPTELRIFRNCECELFYIVFATSELLLLKRTEALAIHKRITEVDSYDINDTASAGQAYLTIVRKDDAIPLIFDGHLENLGDRAEILNALHVDNSVPVLNHMKRKLTEAKYSLKSNEKTFTELGSLRQVASFSLYKKSFPNLNESYFKPGYKESIGALKLKMKCPIVKMCNKKIVIILTVHNEYNLDLVDVQILLHSNSGDSITYTTKLFKKMSSAPFWEERNGQTINGDEEVALVAVTGLKELKKAVAPRIEFSGCVSFKNIEEDHLVPFENVVVSSMNVLGENFDILSSQEIDEKNVTIAILATTQNTKLVLRHLKELEEPIVEVPDVLSQNLQFDSIGSANNMFLHRKSPYHPMQGVMLVTEENSSNTSYISVYARNPQQLLALIQFIYDTVPYRIIATTSNHRLVSKIKELSYFDEPIPALVTSSLDQMALAASISNQVVIILEYFDKCIVKMNESEDAVTQNKVGKEIDLFIGGITTFLEFRHKLLQETIRGISCFKMVSSVFESGDLVMDVDYGEGIKEEVGL